ncbi:PucR family transcriptional regulator [Athalassotoga saccharophila]|uniref:PucR family transcriptional regulator n=1 Tax=Athalassotoga saccharophila TaxID=1441386 RepID=UPI0013796C12|nr:helix-turn-helix domain-containing protein [Athalassotoga saccharophila]BBJ28017.1 carbohydrate diacid regulator [Athalassotoga saccharophila]
MEIWSDIGEKLIDLFNGDVVCTDREGVPKFSTVEISKDLSDAISIALKTGIRTSIFYNQRHTLVVPVNFINLKGAIALIGYEFSEESLEVFVQHILEEILKNSDEEFEESVPQEIVNGFKDVVRPVLCAVSSNLPSIQLRAEMARRGGKFLKRLESGEEFFIFDEKKINDLPAGCRAGISFDPSPDVAYKQAMMALYYGSDPSGISVYADISASFLISEMLKKKKNILEKLAKYPELIETLKIFFENDASPVKTAKVMKIHRNTILNRLNRVRDITYLDPKNFKDGVILYLILADSEGKYLEQ